MMCMERNIILCGFMGSGKTCVGKRTARMMKRRFRDLDQYIEEQAGKTVSEIFAAVGEEGFRELEAQAAAETAEEEGLVIASGGGTVLFPRNVEAFHRTGGIILLLDVPLPVLQERLKNDKKRPLLQKPNRQQIIEDLYKQRMPLYRAAADFSVKADAPPWIVARRIAAMKF